MYRLELFIKQLPSLLNVTMRNHYWSRKKENDYYYSLINHLARYQKPKNPLKCALISLTRYSPRVPDYDGVVGSFKACVDGLVRCGVLDDDNYNITGPWIVTWQKAKKTEQGIKIIVEEIGERKCS